MSEGRVCCINHTVLKEVTRPSLFCEEIEQREGEFKLGRTCFSSVTFKGELNPFDHTGDFEKMVIIMDSEETWSFYNAKVALLPNTDISESHFVMVFDRCERV